MKPTEKELLEKITTKQHPWYGSNWPRFHDKIAAAKYVTLTLAEKQQLYPSPSWADNRDVKMMRSQLQQALKGNFMLEGEWLFRIAHDTAKRQQPIAANKAEEKS